jgi:type II secretory pathway pseudopilin PulG
MGRVAPDLQAGGSKCGSGSGFSLIEVLTATAMMAAGLTVIAQLFLFEIDANRWSAATTTAAALAGEKLEQLRSLAFFTDETGVPVTDAASDLSVTPASATGGRGLLASPASALIANTPGYVDFLDAAGGWVGAGPVTPRGAVFVRRWSITPLPAHPNDALILQVAVARASAASRGAALRAGDAVVVGLKARRAR